MSVAGFESIGPTGSYQVDSSFATLALDRSGQLVSSQYTNGETTNTSPTRVQIPLNDGEILAISCVNFCALGVLSGGLASVYVDSQAGSIVKYYIFKPGSKDDSTLGMQLFDENERITFDSGWKLFDVRKIIIGISSETLDSSRNYAFVHCSIRTRIRYAKVVIGVAPNETTNYVRTTEFSSYRINGGLVDCEMRTIDIAATRPSRGSSGPGFSNTWDNSATPSALVVDVTGI